jgi:hypothetical protein
MTELGFYPFNHAFGFGEAADVSGNSEDAVAERPGILYHFRDLLFVTAMDSHVGPSRAKRKAIARPMPKLEPITKAVLPEGRIQDSSIGRISLSMGSPLY